MNRRKFVKAVPSLAFIAASAPGYATANNRITSPSDNCSSTT